jgi:hypothetical protein
MATRVWTIGHSTRAFEDVMTMLRATAITVLVDVRSYPASRKFPLELPRPAGFDSRATPDPRQGVRRVVAVEF